MKKADKVACVVIWYNPQIDQVQSIISSYVNQVDKIYVIDNSDEIRTEDHKKILKRLKNCEYISLKKNEGIAKALNIGFHKAIDENFNYVLTLDQDSLCSEGMVGKLLNVAQKLNRDKIQYGIIAAQPDTPQRAPKIYNGLSEKDSVIASGNLVSTEAFLKVGGFKEELFIDYVDCWFSLSIRKNGYKIIQVNDAILHHNLGNIKRKSLCGIKLYPTNHSSLRHYYIARNRIYTGIEFKSYFPKFIRWEKINYLKILIKLFCYEDEKRKKLRMILRGIKDARKGIWGKFR